MSKKLLTNRQQLILILIYALRFINSKQIQQFLMHKDHRRINSWLKDLEEKNFITREFKPRYGVLTKPAICSLTDNGKKYIKQTFDHVDKKYLSRLRNDTNRSTALKARLQVLADMCLTFFDEIEFLETCVDMLQNDVIKQQNEFQFITPAFFHRIKFNLLQKLKPDGFISRKTKDGLYFSFIYIIDAYVPRLTLHYMLKHIFEMIDDEYWENDKIKALNIYFVCPSTMVSIYLRKSLKSYLERYYYETPLNIHFATRNQLYKRQKDPSSKMGWQIISSTDTDY